MFFRRKSPERMEEEKKKGLEPWRGGIALSFFVFCSFSFQHNEWFNRRHLKTQKQQRGKEREWEEEVWDRPKEGVCGLLLFSGGPNLIIMEQRNKIIRLVKETNTETEKTHTVCIWVAMVWVDSGLIWKAIEERTRPFDEKPWEIFPHCFFLLAPVRQKNPWKAERMSDVQWTIIQETRCPPPQIKKKRSDTVWLCVKVNWTRIGSSTCLFCFVFLFFMGDKRNWPILPQLVPFFSSSIPPWGSLVEQSTTDNFNNLQWAQQGKLSHLLSPLVISVKMWR